MTVCTPGGWKHLTRVRTGVAVTVPDYLVDLISSTRCTPSQARGLIYRALVRAANRALPAPSGEVLAVICMYDSGHGTVNPIRQLENLGLIEVRRHQRSRRVRIISTGKWTAPCSDDRPHWRERRRLDSLEEKQRVGAM